ncbi:MAG: phosphoribosyl-AMP cyclohydrolase [Alphaproteobacteria bacterium]
MTDNASEPKLSKAELEGGSVFAPRFDANGLMPAIVTDAKTGDVLMVAYMNAEALNLTLKTGQAHFWSRSRKSLWLKGETSGNVLHVVELLTDCDQDTLVVKVNMGGDAVACHTGRKSCFYRRVKLSEPSDDMNGGEVSLAFIPD